VAAASLAIGAAMQRQSTELRIDLAAARSALADQEAAGRRRQELAAAERTRLEASAAEWSRLQTELAALKASSAGSQAGHSQSEIGEAVGFTKAASDWRNVGRHTPLANLETALWAAGGGDVDTLAGLVTFHDNARAKAAAVLAQLPPEIRAKYDSPEKMVAFFTVQDIPATGSVRVLAEGRANEGERRLSVLFFNDHAPPEEQKRYDGVRELAFRPDEGGWKLVVPASAVEQYAAMLKGKTVDH
jgi:hypothetical protein